MNMKTFDKVDDLRKVNEMLQAEVSEVSSTLVMLVGAFNKIMANQNNMNRRLEALDAHQIAMVGRIGELEARQDPAKHNKLAGVVVLPEGEVSVYKAEEERHNNVVPIRDEEEETHS